MKTEKYQIWGTEEFYYEQAFGFIPNVMAYLHEDEKEYPAMIIVPGGGYRGVSPLEGELVALKFFEKGYQTFVLTYTTDLLQTSPLKKQPLNDISRAVRFLRRHAEEFQIKDNLVIVCGFSAGAHVCGSLCVHYEDVTDCGDFAGYSNRPDAAILSYPVITSGELAHRDSFITLLGSNATEEELTYFSLEKQVTEKTPPCFIWATATDELVPVENSEMFARACKQQDVAYALHVFSDGKHGLSLADQDWASGAHMNLYTMEQLMKVMEKVQTGEITLDPEMLDMLGNNSNEYEKSGKVGIPNSEAAAWVELSCAFIKKQILDR